MWPRFGSNLVTSYQPADAAGEPRLEARIQNISRGGIALVVDRRFESGSLLSVELPCEPGKPPTLALVCVVHVQAKGPNEWALGCTFARELGDEDLQDFGARRERPTPPDNRVWVRYPCSTTAKCQLALESEEPDWPALVLNLSANGIGLLVERYVRPGTLLNLELRGATGGAVLPMLACVVRVAPEGERWAIGCNFISELSEAELNALL